MVRYKRQTQENALGRPDRPLLHLLPRKATVLLRFSSTQGQKILSLANRTGTQWPNRKHNNTSHDNQRSPYISVQLGGLQVRVLPCWPSPLGGIGRHNGVKSRDISRFESGGGHQLWDAFSLPGCNPGGYETRGSGAGRFESSASHQRTKDDHGHIRTRRLPLPLLPATGPH